MCATEAYIDRVVQTMESAADICRHRVGREGNVITVTPAVAGEIMITGDLHGHRANFLKIRDLADLANHPRRRLILQEVTHGGPVYDNGGDQSHQVLEDVAKLITEFPEQVHFLPGNHEMAEVTAYPIMKSGQMLNFLFRLGLEAAYGPASPRVEEAYHAFIKSCPLAVRTPQRIVIVHSTPTGSQVKGFNLSVLHHPLDTRDLTRGGDVFNLLWGRDYSEGTAQEFAQMLEAGVLILGHEPCPEGYQVPNSMEIILDCSKKPACYLMLPLDQALTQEDLKGLIRQVHDQAPPASLAG